MGRPLAAMLANDGATIYSIDVDSIFVFKRGALRKTEATPEEAVGQSDVVVTVSAVFFFFPSHCSLLPSAPLAPILRYDYLDNPTRVTWEGWAGTPPAIRAGVRWPHPVRVRRLCCEHACERWLLVSLFLVACRRRVEPG